jgi:hypothetical protein
MAEQEIGEVKAADSTIAFADTLIRWVKKKRLEAPATLFLEMHRPLMPLAFPAAVMLGTFAAPFFGPDYYDQIEALRDPAVLDRVLARLADRKTPNSNETPKEDPRK